MKYSAFSLVYEALRGHSGWTPAWRDPEPKREYDVIIVGGGAYLVAPAVLDASLRATLFREQGVERVEGAEAAGNVDVAFPSYAALAAAPSLRAA